MGAEFSKILLIDGSELIRALLKNALADLGIPKIDEAAEAPSALQMLIAAFEAGDPYHAIFSDSDLTAMTGIQLLENLRADERFRDIPFVMVTAESEKQFVVQALSGGAMDYIVKPIVPATLKRKLQMIQIRVQGHNQRPNPRPNRRSSP